ncbi:endonuclease/exonuclease/phosphatase family protein [Spongiactinospora sp. TRM90649]|uniref:endonuclease/exonuclease/phosphatase family protein n=1 Tax=Spongiactinospora sp. TRM90649 TaxID=3031114 RepID=UPI0023F6E1D8|nr:endonuclease/exonuclease/phosphatase family protein [Spongiactinospora sp. TRM90649]MDF5751103.1 hypothetical protein [Spongiactinospora sp. TRM90649]
MKLVVAGYNIDEGGLDDGSEARLLKQLDQVAPLKPDLFGVEEAKRWNSGPKDDNDRLLNLVATRLGMSYRTLVPSNHHGCHLAMFVRKRTGLRVVREHHDHATPWWHAQGAVELFVDGWGPLWFLNVHLAPASPEIRLAEAEAFDLYSKRPAVIVGDFNAAPTGEAPRANSGVSQEKIRRKGDQRAASAIEGSGFVDLAKHFGDLTPTVGHRDGLYYRADRIYSNLPEEVWESYAVVEEDGEPLSDHRLVVARCNLAR